MAEVVDEGTFMFFGVDFFKAFSEAESSNLGVVILFIFWELWPAIVNLFGRLDRDYYKLIAPPPMFWLAPNWLTADGSRSLSLDWGVCDCLNLAVDFLSRVCFSVLRCTVP